MKKFQIVGLVLFAVFAFSAMAAASASAEGPWWIILLLSPEELLHHLEWPEEEKIEVAADEVAPVLDGAGGTNIECADVKIGGVALATGFILGGNPGTDLADLEFTGCHVQGLPNCLAGNLPEGATEDLIDVSVRTVLTYGDVNNLEDRTLALVAFFPDNTVSPGTADDLFVDFTILNATGSSECGILLNNLLVEVLAKGTEVGTVGATGHTVLFDKKCGVLAEIGLLNSVSLEFEESLSGEEFETNVLSTLLLNTEAFLLLAPDPESLLIECLLLAFGEPAEELVDVNVLLESRDLFGWENE